jgi:hypothetical protein
MKNLPAIGGGKLVCAQYLLFGSSIIGEEEILEVSQRIRFGILF